MNRNGQIIRIIPARTKEIRKTKNRSPSDILGKSASYRDFERFRSRDVVESPFPVHGATRKMEGRGEREGIDYWSLCQANAISRIDSIHASRGCKHRSTVNDEFFAPASLAPREMRTLLPDRNICLRNNMA